MFRIVVLILFFFITPTIADDGFQTTSEEIYQSLTTPTKKTPRLKTRSLRKPLKHESKTRKIVVTEKIGEEIQETPILVNESDYSPRVQMKIEFAYDSYEINDKSVPLLKKLGYVLLRDDVKNENIIIKGHTDSDGSDKYNLNLSCLRGLSVKYFLMKEFNIPESRLKVFGYGEAIAIAPNDTAENKQKNRRVEIQLAKFMLPQ